MGHHDEAKLDVKFIDFARQMNLYLNHFPKHEKFGLSQAIRCKAYEVYGFIVESQKRYQKKTSLTNLDICHEQLRMLLRLAQHPICAQAQPLHLHAGRQTGRAGKRDLPPWARQKHRQFSPFFNHTERPPP